LLRKEADGPAMSGRARYDVPQSADGSLWLRFRMVRVWEREAAEVLAGPLATLPLAPLARVSANELPAVVRRMEERIDREAPPEDRGMLWTTTFLQMGLKYKRETARELLKGVLAMKESDTCMAILEEGEEKGLAKGAAQEARKILVRLGSRRFGVPVVQTQTALEAIDSVERLEQLIDRIPDVESWAELLKKGDSQR